ncbi:MAG: ERAP1-like C-terminal domain-containing protein, partial [Angustibacter sp.]
VELDISGEVTAVPELIGRTQPDLLLLNDDDLAYAKIRLDSRSLATATQGAIFDSSMPRALVLGAAWDMLRDAESTAHSFVQLGLTSFATETDSTVLRTLLSQVATAVRLYSDPARRPDLRRLWVDRLFALAEAAAPGSDQQLQLAQASAAAAETGAQTELVARLLSGETSWYGLHIDTDMRWSLLTSLVVAGAVGEEQIEAELARDQTANGQRAAAQARAAVATPAAKEAAWARVVGADDLPNALQESVIAGFGRVQDPELLRPFVDRYFAALLDIWATRTNEIAQQLVVGLFPTLLADAELLAAADSWLDDHAQAPAGLVRLVRENRDGVARALRVQAVDVLS